MSEELTPLEAAKRMRDLSPFEREILIRAAGDKVHDMRHVHPCHKPLNA